MMNIEVQQIVNVLNTWLEPHSMMLVERDNAGRVSVYHTDGSGTPAQVFPTVPHAVEWALNEARKRDRSAAHDAGLKGWLTDAIEDGDDDAR